VHPEASAELDHAIDWYEERSPGTGADLWLAVDDALALIAADTGNDVPVPYAEDTAARRLLLSKFPYAIVFMELDGNVIVLAFAHHKRKPGYWRDRK
jgi:plasmid stabilization system protein ParE